MTYSAIVFDLDGTLLDSLADLAEAANTVLAGQGLPVHPIDAYRFFVGSGVTKLFERTIPPARIGEELVARCVAQFREVYGQRWNVHTKPYDGVCDLLDALAARQIKMAVLSNKPHAFTELCVSEYFGDRIFDLVLGQRDDVPPKPDPAGAREIVQIFRIAPERFLYVGDTSTDMQTATRAGMFPMGVAWGFRPRAELQLHGANRIIEHPHELLQFLADD